jgi:hypothetical protein
VSDSPNSGEDGSGDAGAIRAARAAGSSYGGALALMNFGHAYRKSSLNAGIASSLAEIDADHDQNE